VSESDNQDKNNQDNTPDVSKGQPKTVVFFKHKLFWIGIVAFLVLFSVGGFLGYKYKKTSEPTIASHPSNQSESSKFTRSILFSTYPTIDRLEKNEESCILHWNMQTSETITGYNIYYGTEKNKLHDKISVANINQYDLQPALKKGKIYFISVSAIDKNAQQSKPSKKAIVIR